MSGGAGLQLAKRGPGRPKGSGNKRSKDLKGYVDARFGGSAAQQMAALCMVTPAEVKAAGSVLEARVAKAVELAKAIGCTTKEAFEILGRELAALAPYTDQRQPLAVEAVGDGFRPAFIALGGSLGVPIVPTTEKAGEFQLIEGEVSRSKSHDQGQLPVFPDETSA